MKCSTVIAALCMLTTLPAQAELYTVNCNVPVELVLPVKNTQTQQTGYVKARGDDAWRSIALELIEGHLHVAIDPAAFDGRDILILVNPQPGRNINDHMPPSLLEVAVDGVALASTDTWQPDPMAHAPDTIRWVVKDAGNAIATASVDVRVNGVALPKAQIDADIKGRNATINARLKNLDYGNYRLTFRVADDAPEANQLVWEAQFSLFDATNLIRAAGDRIEVDVDSHFQNYPSSAPLTDGVRTLPGSSAGNDVTWASAETDAPHWIDVSLPEAVPLQEVTIYWARPNAASQNVKIQVLEDGEWQTVAETPLGGYSQRQAMTFRFDPVTANRFRAWQPPGGGAPSRPNLMWVTEIEAR